MKKLATLFIACSLLVLSNTAFAQSTCCTGTTTAPAIGPGHHGVKIDSMGWTPAQFWL